MFSIVNNLTDILLTNKTIELTDLDIIFTINGYIGGGLLSLCLIPQLIKTIKLENNKFLIACQKNAIEVLELQIEGKKAMKADDFLRGLKNTFKIC